MRSERAHAPVARPAGHPDPARSIAFLGPPAARPSPPADGRPRAGVAASSRRRARPGLDAAIGACYADNGA